MTADDASFTRQLRAMLPRLVNVGVAYFGSRQDAEDLASDVCLRAWSRRNQWSGEQGSFEPWVWKIFHSRKADRFREQGKRPDTKVDTELVETIAIDHCTSTPERALLRQEQLIGLLQRLPIQFREVVIEVRIVGRGYEETARLLDLPIGTVMSRLNRAKQILDAARGAD